jgi:hypothetical protein
MRRLLAGFTIAAACAYAIGFLYYGTPILWTVIWCSGLALMALAPRRPVLAPAIYAATMYGTPRYSALFESLAASGLLHVEAAVAVAAAAFWVRQGSAQWSGRVRHGTFGALELCAGLLFIWIGIAYVVPRTDPVGLDYSAQHAPVLFVHAALFFGMTSRVMGHPWAMRDFVLPLLAALALRVLWQGADGLRLENDIGPLAVIVLPLLFPLVRTGGAVWIRWAAALGCVGALTTVALTYNRASAVALAAVLLATIWQHRRDPWVLSASVVAAFGAVAWLTMSGYADRFMQAWSEMTGLESGSVTERFALWHGAWAMLLDHPWLGVGPGNYSGELETYAPQLRGLVAHNSYIHMGAETGFPGLLFYCLLFGLAIVRSGRMARRARGDASATASALQASLCGYLTAGIFMSRHDMVLAYMLAGWVAALPYASPFDEGNSSREPAP